MGSKTAAVGDLNQQRSMGNNGHHKASVLAAIRAIAVCGSYLLMQQAALHFSSIEHAAALIAVRSGFLLLLLNPAVFLL